MRTKMRMMGAEQAEHWLESREKKYWTFQILGWTAFTVLSYFSLTLWYNPGEWVYFVHTVIQSVLGLFISHPLRPLSSWAWNKPTWQRVLIISIGIILAGLAWTIMRLVTLDWITGEVVSPSDWGGWLNASIIVYGAWAFSYHALKYYQEWIDQREIALAAQQSALAEKAKAQAENLKRLSLETQFKESKLRILKYQLNPHFLFNALNSVSALVKRGEPDRASEMISKIADLLRVSLDHEDELVHSLADELGVIDLYLQIEKLRFGERLQTDFRIDSFAAQAEVPSFLLQPLFENAMKYAVGKSLTPTLIQCETKKTDDRLSIILMDTGPGIDTNAAKGLQNSTGIGIRNTEERLRSHFGDDFVFTFSENKPKGTRIEIVIPYKAYTPPSLES